jgi:hypothetical protein
LVPEFLASQSRSKNFLNSDNSVKHGVREFI